MNSTLRFLAIFSLISLMAVPASAFTADSLSIDVLENGNATVTFSYSLGWLEKGAVFLNIADPVTELKNALESNSGKEVTVQEVTDNSASFLVAEYAHMNAGENDVTYTTPTISFASAEDILSGYWFAPLISVDLSPAETTVTFSDGYVESFNDAIEIPKISHSITLA